MKLKLTMLLGLLVIASLVLSACGGGAPTEAPVATEAPATEPPAPEPTEAPATEPPAAEPAATLKIWGDDTRTPILQELAPGFLEKYGVELTVEDLGKLQDIRSQVILAVPAGEGPDIYVCVHDWLGALVESGLAAPVDLGAATDKFVPSTLEAFTYTDGLLYGLPYASENLGFFYNTELVPEPPTTWDEVLEIGRQLKSEGKVEYAIAINGDGFYNAMPIETAFGGYVFGKDANGAWNPDDVGLDSEGEIAAVTWMADAAEEGLMPKTFDLETSYSLFETGKMPFLMTGPWAFERIRASGVPYAVAPAFPDNGAPFSGVQGFCVNPMSENQLLAQAFLTEFVATDEFMQKIADAGSRPSAFTSVLEKTSDPDLKAMGQSGVNAIPMPNIPEMGSVWTAANNGIALAVSGDQTPEQSMKDAADQIRGLISGAFADMVNIPGSYQKEAGCAADWDPACQKTAMTEGSDGKYTVTVQIPAGEYEYKAALGGAWAEAYGSDGTTSGGNYTLSLPADSTVTFTYDPETHLVEAATE